MILTKPKGKNNWRHRRNGHLLELDGCMWRCLQCRHEFDAAADANIFRCGDPCNHQETQQ